MFKFMKSPIKITFSIGTELDTIKTENANFKKGEGKYLLEINSQ